MGIIPDKSEVETLWYPSTNMVMTLRMYILGKSSGFRAAQIAAIELCTETVHDWLVGAMVCHLNPSKW